MSRLGSLADTSLSIRLPEGPGSRGPAMSTGARRLVNHSELIGLSEENQKNTFTRMRVSEPSTRTNLLASETADREKYELGAYGYGKNNVKLLHVRRHDSHRHEIREYEIDVHLRLESQLDYLEGDNRHVIATDSQKNTVYLLAKKFGLQSPEDFGLLICSHFLYTYKHVEEVNVKVEEYPWSRIDMNGEPHNHAFVFTPTATRYCQVMQIRNESPRIRGGLKNLRVLKTTQSAFTDFIQDEYRTLPDSNDRIFSTVVTASWEFSTAKGVDFDRAWDTVRDCILENFAGPAKTGIFSPSVQNTLYLTEKCILGKISQIYSVEMQMPNKHYFTIDLSSFRQLVQGENKEVYLPIDKPSGIIYAQLNRKDITSKL